MNDWGTWLAKFARLRIDTLSPLPPGEGLGGGGFAPHKPLLLLVVLDLAQEGAFMPSPAAPASGYPGLGRGGPAMLPLSPQLAFRFCSYWSIVAHRRNQKPDVRFPFTKLKTEGVWTPLDAHGQPMFPLPPGEG